MFAKLAENTRKAISATAAIAIVSASALVMDQAHLAAAPRGTVEIGELTPVGEQVAALPEVVVLAKREATQAFAATTQLPEVIVVAKRVVGVVAKNERKRFQAPAINAGF